MDEPAFAALLDTLGRGPDMETILISGGRKDRVRPGDILGALTGEAGGRRGPVQCLTAGRIKGKRFRATLVGPLAGTSRLAAS